MYESFRNYLKRISLPVSQRLIEDLVKSHPAFPALVSFSDALTILGVDHEIVRRDEDQPYLKFPYLNLTQQPMGYGLRLIEREEDLNFDRHTDDEEPTKVIFKVNEQSDIRLKKNKQMYRQEIGLKIFAILFLFSVFSLLGPNLLAGINNLSFLGVKLFSVAGLIVSAFIFYKEVGFKSSSLDSFCRAKHQRGKDDCQKLIQSSGSKLYGIISLGDLSLLYFSLQFLLLILIGEPSAAHLKLFSIIGLATLPVVIYSIWHQYRVSKIWCKLCLTVDTILVVQFFLLAEYIASTAPFFDLFTPSNLYVVGALFMATGSIGYIFKTAAKNYVDEKYDTYLSKRAKLNDEVFLFLYEKEEPIHIGYFDQEITLGNKEAPLHLIVVAMPTCSHCAKELESLMHVIRRYPGSFYVTIRFQMYYRKGNTLTDYAKRNMHLSAYWLKEIASMGSPNEKIDRTAKYFKDWYSDGLDKKQFLRKYPLEEISKNSEVLILADKYSKWISKYNLYKYPTFILNGRVVPEIYRAMDLLWLETDLREHFSKENQFIQEIPQRE